jgi:hypothetical protein
MKRILSVLLLALITSWSFAGIEVYAPTLKSPADNAPDQMPNVTLSWNAVVGSTGLQYQIQIDTSLQFNSAALQDTTQVLLAGYTAHQLFFGAKYYWRVRAIDLGQTSAWSLVRSFNVFNQVTLSFPKNNAAQDTLAPIQQLTWASTISGKTITGVKNYDVQADTSQNFNSSQLHQGTVAGGKYSFTVSNLRFGAKYYWRVRAHHDKSTSAWSAIFNFTVTSMMVPTTPQNNATDQVLDAQMNWKAVKGILGYEYQLALDQNFTTVIAGSDVAVNYAKSEFTVFGTKYYWRVRGRHISDTTQWCATMAFTTIDKVKLSSPSNNTTNLSLKPTLKWNKQTGIVKYQLQMDLVGDFANPWLDQKFADSIISYQVTKKMSNSTKYYWRMRAFSDSQLPDTSGWSEVWNFTTTASTGIGETALQSSGIYPNPASGKVTVRFELAEETKVEVSVIDLLGSTFIREEYELNPGLALKEINISNLSKGIYIVRISFDGNVANHKLIVDR